MKLQMPLLFVVMGICFLYAMHAPTRRAKRQCVVLITVTLALFSGLRTWWFGDLIKYYTLYVRCNGSDWWAALTEDWSNMGIRWFFHYAGAIGISYDNCILIIATLVAVTLGLLIYRYSPSPFWSYVMYIAMGFYMFTYSGLKQAIAMSFLILAAMAMFENKLWKFLLYTMVGGFFHAPALIFLVAYPFCRQRLNRRYFLVLIGLFAALFLFRTQIVNFMNDIYYEDKDTVTATKEVGGRFIMMLLIMAMGIVLRPLKKWDRVYFQTFNMMVLAAALQTMSVYGNVFSRLSDYYYQFIALYVPFILQPGRSQAREMPQYRNQIFYWEPKNYLLLGIGIIMFSLWYYNNYIDSGWAMLQSFQFRWEIDPYALYYGY